MFGPGLLFAGAAIGTSHLVQSTRAGADFGFALLWMVLLINICKYPFFEFTQRYTAAFQKNAMHGYFSMNKWVFIYLFLSSCAAIPTIAAISFIASMLLAYLFNFAIDPFYCLLAVVILASIILLRNHYQLFDRLNKYILAVLVVTTLVCSTLALIQHGHKVALSHPHPIFTLVNLSFFLALMGWMPAPIESSIWTSVWTEKSAQEKEISILPMKSILFDFNVGYLASTVMAVAFLSLGALVMYGTGIHFSSSGPKFVSQLIDLFTNMLGDWSKILIAFAAGGAMFSTVLTCLDSYPRVLSEGLQIIKPTLSQQQKRMIYVVWLLVLIVMSVLFTTIFKHNLYALVDFVTILAFITAPLYGLFNWGLVMKLDKQHRPPPWLILLSIVGWIVITGLMLTFLYAKLFPHLF